MYSCDSSYNNNNNNNMHYTELLKSLTAVGIKDFRKRSVLHWGCISLSLRELFRAFTVRCRGWEELPIIDVSLCNILLSPTCSTDSRGQARTELAFFISLLILFLSLSELPPPPTHNRIKQHRCHNALIKGP